MLITGRIAEAVLMPSDNNLLNEHSGLGLWGMAHPGLWGYPKLGNGQSGPPEAILTTQVLREVCFSTALLQFFAQLS